MRIRVGLETAGNGLTAALPGQDAGVVGRRAEELLVFLLALGCAAALFLFRSMDDNRLTSWDWVFAHWDPVKFFALSIAGIAGAYFLSRLPFPGPRPAATLLILSYASGALFWAEPEVIVDAARYFTQAKHLELYGIGYFLRQWGGEIQAWTDLPLVPFLYGMIFKFLGESRIYIQAFTTLLFSMAVLLTYQIGRSLWNEELGFWAGALLLGFPYLLTQVPSMLVDVPTMFFFTLAILAFIRALDEGGRARIALASAALFLAFFSKYSLWPLLLVLLPICIVSRPKNTKRRLQSCAWILFISGALVCVAAAAHQEVFSRQISLLLGYQAPGLRRWGESFFSTFLFQIHPFVTAAALFSMFLALGRKDLLYLIPVSPVILFLAFQVERIRYLIPLFPMLSLMAAYGLQAISSKEVRAFAAACAVVSSCLLAGYGFLPFLKSISTVNLKHAGQFLDRIPQERVEALVLPQPDSGVNPAVCVPILDLFTKKQVMYREEVGLVPEKGQIEDSPLRFTWEYKTPGYYAPEEAEGHSAFAVISREVHPLLPERTRSRLQGYRLTRVFKEFDEIFRYRTIVAVYQPD